MTSDRPIGDPSAPVDPPLGDPALAELVRERGRGRRRLCADIPVFSRIAKAARRCDDVVSAGSEPTSLRKLAGTELDPAIVDALASMLDRAG